MSVSLASYRLRGRPRGDSATPAVRSLASPRVAELAWYGFVLAAIAAFGALNLFQPMPTDAALFLLGARAIDAGQVLYVDFWDNKQPGIYVFYWVAGKLFGFREEGVFAFELAWMLVLSVVLIAGLRHYFRQPWLAGVVPLALLGVYYFHAGPRDVGQLEMISALPTTICVLLLAGAWRTPLARGGACVVAGAAAGITVVFKLALAPMFIPLVLLATWEAARRQQPGHRLAVVPVMWIGFTLGVALVLGAVALAFAARGALDALLWTSFAYPHLVLRDIDAGLIATAPAMRLVNSAGWYLAIFSPWLLFAAFSLSRLPRAEEPALSRLLLVWLLSAAGVVLIQRFSWWTWHLMLLFVPTVVLVVRGVDVALVILRQRLPTHPKLLMPAAVLLVFPPLASMLPAAAQEAKLAIRMVAHPDYLPTEQDFHRGDRVDLYRQRMSEDYRLYMPMTEFLRRPDSLPGPIYVFGNALIYLFAGRTQALPEQGCCWDLFVSPQWEMLPRRLEQFRPIYVFVDPPMLDMIPVRSPAAWAVLEGDYVVERDEPTGRWYRLADQRPATEQTRAQP